ncbi:MAG: hypothetical protein K2N63_08405, partial [Lachnospiraceae bacterium]|nr:hypothetical protein [Lachnospiraceae bacterium]
YQMDGYKTLAEFAQAEYGMKPSGVSRFLRVYKKYCENGELKERYEKYTYAQLVEMLNLPAEDEALIRPDTPREDIRYLKRFNREGENDIHALEHWKEQASEEEEQEGYLKNMLQILFQNEEREADFNAICGMVKEGRQTEKAFSELINPSGNKSIRNGRTMTFLFENEIRIKIWGQDAPVVFQYGKLLKCFIDEFREVLEESGDWWKRQFTPDNDAAQEQDTVPEPKIAEEKKGNCARAKKEDKKALKRAPEIKPEEDAQIPGQDTILNHAELLPDGYKESENQVEAKVDGDLVPAAVEPAPAQLKEECLSLISGLQGNVTLERYAEARLQAEQLMEYLEVMAG